MPRVPFATIMIPTDRPQAHAQAHAFAGIVAAIVDLDGTMVDTLGDFHASLADVFASRGWPTLDRSTVEGMIGKGSEHLVRAALARVGQPETESSAVMASYQAAYRRINGQHAEVFAGVREGLAAMRAKGWRLACVTNKPREFALALLEQKDLLAHFERVHGGDDFPKRKPDPMPLVKTCQAMKLEPRSVLMVGDSINDAIAARGAGMPVLLLTHGYNHGQDVRELLGRGLADAVGDRLDEALAA